MGMDVGITGRRSDKSEKFKKMQAIYDACREAGIEVPEKVNAYFNGGSPKEALEVRLEEGKHYKIVNDDGSNEYFVKLSDLPEDVDTIVFGHYY